MNIFFRTPKSYLLVFSIFAGLNFACTSDQSEYKRLRTYYANNIQLHTKVFEALTKFCKENNTDVTLRKSDVIEAKIVFRFHYANSFFPIEYDADFNRHDPFPDLTSQLKIPLSLIKDFDQSIYTALSSDTLHTFFGSTWRIKSVIGTQADSQYGVLLSLDSNEINHCEEKISSNACLISRGIH